MTLTLCEVILTTMIYPSADKLDAWGSKYQLTVLAAKRAKQVKIGFSPLLDTDSRNPLTVSLEEIGAGEITAVPIVVEKAPTLGGLDVIEDEQTAESLLGGLDEIPFETLDGAIEEALEVEPEDEADYVDDEENEVLPLDELVMKGGDDDLVVNDEDEVVEEEPAFEGSEVELEEESEDSWKSEDDLEE